MSAPSSNRCTTKHLHLCFPRQLRTEVSRCSQSSHRYRVLPPLHVPWRPKSCTARHMRFSHSQSALGESGRVNKDAQRSSAKTQSHQAKHELNCHVRVSFGSLSRTTSTQQPSIRSRRITSHADLEAVLILTIWFFACISQSVHLLKSRSLHVSEMRMKEQIRLSRFAFSFMKLHAWPFYPVWGRYFSTSRIFLVL